MRSTGTRSLLIAAIAAAIALIAAVGTAAAATIPIQGGEVDWGVKESFRKYVKGPIAKGQIAVSGGAVEAADGTFKFPVAAGTYDTATHITTVEGTGTVRFTGHDEGAGPVLDVVITDPVVEVGPETGAVFADVESRPFSPGPPAATESFPGVELATLDSTGIMPSGGPEEVSLAGVPSELTAEGAKAFAGFYTAGTAFDPVGIVASFVPTTPPTEEGGGGTPEDPKVDPPKTDDPPKGDDAPKADSPATPAPVLPMPQLKRAAAGGPTLGRGGAATVATVACPTAAACTLAAPRHVAFKAGGEKFNAKVIAPRWILAGKTAKVAVKVPRPALAALAGGKAQVAIDLTLGIGEQSSTETVKATLKGQAG
jgi:hypothetical protein